MKQEVAQFMVKEIDARLATRKRKLDPVLEHKLGIVRNKVRAGFALNEGESVFLEMSYGRFTDPNRLKWGSHVRL